MLIRRLPLAVLLGLLAAPAAQAQTSRGIDAVTSARYDLRLGFTVDGKVDQVLVEPGDRVEQGQLLIQLDAEERQALVDLYAIRKNSDLEIEAAKAQHELAKLEEKRRKELYDQNAGTWFEYERARVQAELERLRLEVARQSQQEAALQHRQAQVQLSHYSLKAPRAGVVEQVAVSQGETIEHLQPVLRLVVTDPLWVDAAVPTSEAVKLEVGDPAWVTWKGLPERTEPVEGRIIHMAEGADAASATLLVRVEVPNPEGIRFGTHVRVQFTAPVEVAATAVPPGRPDADGEPASVREAGEGDAASQRG